MLQRRPGRPFALRLCGNHRSGRQRAQIFEASQNSRAIALPAPRSRLQNLAASDRLRRGREPEHHMLALLLRLHGLGFGHTCVWFTVMFTCTNGNFKVRFSPNGMFTDTLNP